MAVNKKIIIERYEELRSSVISASSELFRNRRGWGLFYQQGMFGWMKALLKGQISISAKEKISVRAETESPNFSEIIHRQIAVIVTDIVFGIYGR